MAAVLLAKPSSQRMKPEALAIVDAAGITHALILAMVTEVESDESAKLAEVMENLARHELIALDRCHHLYDLKQVWLQLHPEAAAGGDRKSIKAQSLRFDADGGEIFGFGKSVAEKVGLSIRTIETAVKIWTGLAPQTRQRLRGTDLARKQTELKALSEIATPRKQAEVLDAIFNEDLPGIGNVAQASSDAAEEEVARERARILEIEAALQQGESQRKTLADEIAALKFADDAPAAAKAGRKKAADPAQG